MVIRLAVYSLLRPVTHSGTLSPLLHLFSTHKRLALRLHKTEGISRCSAGRLLLLAAMQTIEAKATATPNELMLIVLTLCACWGCVPKLERCYICRSAVGV